MVSSPQEIHHKKSKLEEIKLGFEYNRTLAAERRMTKQRTDTTAL